GGAVGANPLTPNPSPTRGERSVGRRPPRARLGIGYGDGSEQQGSGCTAGGGGAGGIHRFVAVDDSPPAAPRLAAQGRAGRAIRRVAAVVSGEDRRSAARLAGRWLAGSG